MFLAIDVGTGSVRCGLFSEEGICITTEVQPIIIFNYKSSYFEQSSLNIWKSISKIIRKIIKKTNYNVTNIFGLSFDATCSLVCIRSNGTSIPISLENHSDILMWMDHRADLETIIINKTQHEVLNYIGGKISPEMELPKLLWLKRNLPENWAQVEFCFDLTDYLTWKTTGCFSQSV